MMSPPTLLALCASKSAGDVDTLATIRSEKPGANRAICAVTSFGQLAGRPGVAGRHVRVGVQRVHVAGAAAGVG